MTQETTAKVPLLHAEQLSSTRGGRVLFDELSFQLHPGELWQVTGPNGAGKSTLLRMLAGLLEPTEGRIQFNDSDLRDAWQDYCQQLLFIGHKAAVKGELTALENFYWQQQLTANPNTDGWDLLEKLGLLALEDELTGRLSAGQQRRVALTRLWANNATLWILDEPFTSLDVQGVGLLQKRFAEHLNDGGCIIFTSHQSLTLSNLSPKLIDLSLTSQMDNEVAYD
ncbi:heme ABC transporter ATP-binding protein CcmA [Idiomarina sp. X4]|uniref:cytochrome c biogenesis heme-transporting ATPase CcmA n=1 Tax=Idiomarina sp. X4 TaxID=2055892 RepID=UPI000C294C39|nr:cytochrome c biogenesis heme-transporting ATPase CcmA [Idiomarina sp. X4]ATZ72501.1 heme ABC transporter ATP-binding protein CcmA [Idiomarina sp. X4]